MRIIKNSGSKNEGKKKAEDFTLGEKYLVLGPGIFKLPVDFKGNTKDAITKMLEYHLSEENKAEQYNITKIDETIIFFEHNIYKHMMNVLYKETKKTELSINCSIGLVENEEGDFEYFDRIE
jgi:hypothetical protein